MEHVPPERPNVPRGVEAVALRGGGVRRAAACFSLRSSPPAREALGAATTRGAQNAGPPAWTEPSAVSMYIATPSAQQWASLTARASVRAVRRSKGSTRVTQKHVRHASWVINTTEGRAEPVIAAAVLTALRGEAPDGAR